MVKLIRIVRELAKARRKGRHSLFPLARAFGRVAREGTCEGRHEEGRRRNELGKHERGREI